MAKRPALRVNVESASQLSYNIDDEGNTFSSGPISVGASGMSVSTAEAPAKAATVDTKLEDLEDLGVLGEGNSGSVHRVRHRRTGQLYALKLINNIFDRSKRHQMIHELSTLYKADCPFLISFYGAFFKDGAISVLLELMDAGSLSDIIAAVGAIPEPQIAWFTKQILEGLHYLRKRHQVHRDIKPSNICVNTQGQAKLTDFGITTQLASTLEDADTFVGTSAYMSPERIEGKKYSYPSDIWSLGVSLIECAIGKYPYPQTSVYYELMHNIVAGPVPTLPEEKFSPEFRDFVAACLKKDPKERKSASDLLRHPFLGKAADITREQVCRWIEDAVRTLETLGRQSLSARRRALRTDRKSVV